MGRSTTRSATWRADCGAPGAHGHARRVSADAVAIAVDYVIADVTYRLDDGGLSVDEAELYARRVRACKALHARIDTQAVPLDEAGAVADHADPILNRDDVPAPRPRENV